MIDESIDWIAVTTHRMSGTETVLRSVRGFGPENEIEIRRDSDGRWQWFAGSMSGPRGPLASTIAHAEAVWS